MKHGSNIPEFEEHLLDDIYVTFRIYLSPSILCLVELCWNISPHQTVEVLHLLFKYCSWEINPPLFWMLSEDWSFLWTLCWNELYLPLCILFFLVVTQLIQGWVTRCSWGMKNIPYNAIVYSLLKTQSFCSAAAFPSSSQWDPLSLKCLRGTCVQLACHETMSLLISCGVGQERDTAWHCVGVMLYCLLRISLVIRGISWLDFVIRALLQTWKYYVLFCLLHLNLLYNIHHDCFFLIFFCSYIYSSLLFHICHESFLGGVRPRLFTSAESWSTIQLYIFPQSQSPVYVAS